MTVTIKDEQLELLPERAFFWPARRILVFSDVHLGKAAALQSQGIPVPFAKSADLDTIAKLIRRLKPTSIYILGIGFIITRVGLANLNPSWPTSLNTSKI